jgi:ribosome-binding protein aMBF1 (putative translation factor)
MTNKKTSDAVELMDKWYGGDPEWDRMVVEERLKLDVAQIIYDIRTETGLSQTALAKLVGTAQSVISRLENADYDGSALEILFRICTTLHRKVDVERRPSGEVAVAC